MSAALTVIQNWITLLEAHPAPEVKKAADDLKVFVTDLKLALPAIAVAGANDLLASVPFGGLISPLLDPAIAAGATLAEGALLPYLDKFFGIQNQTAPAPIQQS